MQLISASQGGDTPCCRRPPPPALLKGIEEFNRRAYFECHETLEELWNQERVGRRRHHQSPHRSSPASGCDNLYKGILQVGVGCYHLLRRNYHGATVKLQSGADYLEHFAPVCMKVQVAQLIADARLLRAELVALGPDHFTEVDLALLPQVRLAGSTNDEE